MPRSNNSYDLYSFATPYYSTCNETKFLAGSPQKGSTFELEITPPSGPEIQSVEINATIVFGGLWISGSRLVLTTVDTAGDSLVVLTKNDILNSESIDLGCEGPPSNSSFEDYTYNLSVTFYYPSGVKIGSVYTRLLWRMITASGDSAWVAIRDVYLTFKTASSSGCPSKTYRPSPSKPSTRDPCVCKLEMNSGLLILV